MGPKFEFCDSNQKVVWVELNSESAFLNGRPSNEKDIYWFGPLAVRVGKEAMRASQRMAIEEGIYYERDLFCLCFSTEDKKEGVEAFLEKRKPSWKGR